MASTMRSIRTDPDDIAWTPWTEVFGAGAFHDGKPIIEAKTLSDRRPEGGGIAYLLRFRPPAGKLIKVVAVARSDEHVFNLSGGRATKSGRPVSAAGYSLNPDGQPHSAMIARETTAFVLYTGQPDEVTSVEVLDIASATSDAA
ncbi:MAG TPA: hypothetical protein VG651_23200 [Stellaceae bacterium]|nr:hypothetical protein [Stellaceae bacterium]